MGIFMDVTMQRNLPENICQASASFPYRINLYLAFTPQLINAR